MAKHEHAKVAVAATKPTWLKVTYDQKKVDKMEDMLKGMKLNTVCAEANCPNLGECFGSGTASFIILGPNCTRACRFCDIPHGNPQEVDLFEPLRVAQATKKLELSHVVVTSVDRDDLPDLGADQFVRTINAIRELNPDTTIEVLTPDFQGRTDCLDKVIAAKPDVFNHNMETVRSITPKVRVISPLVLGNTLAIHPVTIIFILLAAGKLFGIAGVILGIPGYAVIKVIVNEWFDWYRQHSDFDAGNPDGSLSEKQDVHSQAPPEK